jgi:arylsulfatase A-like enzyme/Flp pilus assembly protein TadD
VARRLGVLLVVALAAGCQGQDAPRAATPAATPGAPIILVTIDTLRADRLPAYGYRGVETPNIDALRRDGVLFANAYSHCPLTLPSHVSLLTGLLPPAHGVRNNLGYRLDAASHPTLPALLKGAGYATGAAVSAWVLRPETGLGAGFDSYRDVPGGTDGRGSVADVQRAGRETVALALEFVAAHRREPFFLFVHLYEPHAPYAPPSPQRERWGATYEGEIAAADAALGDLVAGLKRAAAYDDALVVLASDHGEGLGEHGEDEHGILLYREVLHVPLLVKRPRSAGAGSTVERAVGLVDVMPTLTEAVGVATPPGLAGRSLFAASPAPAAVYSETYYPRIHLGWSELHSLVDERYHLIDGPRPELFDLRHDPAEKQDLARASAPIVAAMTRELGTRRGDFRAPDAVGEAEREKLQALGYLAGGPAEGGARAGSGPNPRDHLGARPEMGKAMALVAHGNDAGAVLALRSLLAREPGFFDAQWELGRVLARSGRLDEAARAYRDAMRLSPTLARSVAAALAEVSLAQGDLDQAARAADLASASDDYGRAAVVGAEVDLRRGRFADALERAQTAADRLRVQGSPPVAGLAFVRGDALARLGRHAEAEAALREEIGHFPGTARAYASLALVVALQGRPEEAPGILEAMQRARPGAETVRLAARARALMTGGKSETQGTGLAAPARAVAEGAR